MHLAALAPSVLPTSVQHCIGHPNVSEEYSLKILRDHYLETTKFKRYKESKAFVSISNYFRLF